MRVLKENAVNDLEIGVSNQLAVLVDLDAIAQACTSAMDGQRGEMQYDILRGIPTDATVWAGVPNLPQFEFFARGTLGNVEGVTEVLSFSVQLSGERAVYAAAINTIFGPTTVEGIIGDI